MRSVSIALAALIGAAAANPVVEWPRNYNEYGHPYHPTGVSSSSLSASTSSYAPSSSSSSYIQPSSSSSSLYPSSSSSSSVYYSSSSSTKPYSSSGTGYVPSSTKGGDHTYPPISTGVSSSKPPHPPISTGVTTETEVITTYTTETICPVTKTYGTQVVTTLTTSTITITSCKKGCHHQPTSTPVVPPNPTGPITIPTTITTTTYTFVPCSTSVGHNGPTVIYSTYLTSSAITKTYTTDVVFYPTLPSQPPVVTPVALPASCPAPVTVYNTVTVTVAPQPCHECSVKTYTITEGGSTTCITVTDYPTVVPSSSIKPTHPHSSKPIPTGASGSSSIPYSTGSVPYPTHGHSSVPYSSSRTGPKPTGYSHNHGY